MSKAKQRALERFPVHEDASKEWIESHLKGICSDYIEGYRQAEKDLALTWEDIREICTQSVLVELDLGRLVSDERHYTEVLNRFNKYKEK